MFPENGEYEARGGTAWPTGALTVCGVIVSGAGRAGKSGNIGPWGPALGDLVICGLGDNCGAEVMASPLCFV